MAIRAFSRKLILTVETAAIVGALILFPLNAWGQDSGSAEVPAQLVEAEKIQALLHTGKFAEAESLARECVDLSSCNIRLRPPPHDGRTVAIEPF